MRNKEFGKKLEKRTKDFAIYIIRFSASISNGVEKNIVKNQITKSGSSIGANYREANQSRSKADFKSKIGICKSEANETIYWLEIIEELNWQDKNRCKQLIVECKELFAIFMSIFNKLK